MLVIISGQIEWVIASSRMRIFSVSGEGSWIVFKALLVTVFPINEEFGRCTLVELPG
jgi:hypothetical protein